MQLKYEMLLIYFTSCLKIYCALKTCNFQNTMKKRKKKKVNGIRCTFKLNLYAFAVLKT